MNIGKIIRDLRKDKGITQTQLAEKISTTQDTISLWELGKSYPDIINLIKLSKFFGVSTDYMLGLKDF